PRPQLQFGELPLPFRRLVTRRLQRRLRLGQRLGLGLPFGPPAFLLGAQCFAIPLHEPIGLLYALQVSVQGLLPVVQFADACLQRRRLPLHCRPAYVQIPAQRRQALLGLLAFLFDTDALPLQRRQLLAVLAGFLGDRPFLEHQFLRAAADLFLQRAQRLLTARQPLLALCQRLALGRQTLLLFFQPVCPPSH